MRNKKQQKKKQGPSLLRKRGASIVRVKPQLPPHTGPITRVRLFSLRSEGVDIVGDMCLRDGKIVADPADSIALRNVLAEPVWLPEGDGWRFIYSDTQPEEFLAALPKEYNGSYCWCEAVASTQEG